MVTITMSKTDQKELLKTLELAGVMNPAPSKIKVLEFSNANMQENNRVREAANKLIISGSVNFLV